MKKASDKRKLVGLPEQLGDMDEIDVQTGLMNCGSCEGYLYLLKTIDKQTLLGKLKVFFQNVHLTSVSSMAD